MLDSYHWPEYGEIKKGDCFKLMITGMIGLYTAEVIGFDELRGGRPILQVYDEKTVSEPPLKPGDYILMERL